MNQNLKPFVKGQSGNVKGRPPVSDIRSMIRDVISEPCNGSKTKLEAIVNNLVKLSLQGNVRAVEVLFSYAYGKPKDNNETPLVSVIMPKAPSDF